MRATATSDAAPVLLAQTQYTALHIAAQWNSSEVATLLLDAKANPNLKTKDGKTALHLAAGKDAVDVTGVLLERGIKKNLKNDAGDMALDIAIKSNCGNVVALLREKGAPASPLPRSVSGRGTLQQSTQSVRRQRVCTCR